jgi:single-strand DNA-binding protein
MSKLSALVELDAMPPVVAPAISNLCVLHGFLSSDPVARDLPSGSLLVQLQVTTPGATAQSVPVASIDGPKNLAKLKQGDHLLVVGTVCRRFFKAGGGTVSRTEVVATHITKLTSKRAVSVALATATEHMRALVQSLADAR